MVRVTIDVSAGVIDIGWYIDTLTAMMHSRRKRLQPHEVEACAFAHNLLVSAKREIDDHDRRRQAGLHDLPTKIADALSKPPWIKPE